MVCKDGFARWRNRAFGGKIGSLGMIDRRRVSGKISFTVDIKATTITSIDITNPEFMIEKSGVGSYCRWNELINKIVKI